MQGKYRDNIDTPSTARLAMYKGRYAEAESRYGRKPNLYEAVEAYCQIADKADISPSELALR